MEYKEMISLPIPPHYNPDRVGEVWRVAYQQRAAEARAWAKQYHIPPASQDQQRIALVAIDVQNSFCIPDFELFVGGRSGLGAVEDNRRLCEFIYRNLHRITHIAITLDTHLAMQIFHPVFLINQEGVHPEPLTTVSYENVSRGIWRFNPEVAHSLGIDVEYGQRHLEHYTRTLAERGKYALTIWPYHVMLGSIGHALVSAVEEAIFFHTVARYSQVEMLTKGNHPLTEHYSAINPEVREGADGKTIVQKDERFINILKNYDMVIIAGQAKSHCVAWTIEDLLGEIRQTDEKLVKKVYLLEDCTSPVVVPGVVDYTAQADEAFQKFAEAGMHIVRSTQSILSWPGVSL